MEIYCWKRREDRGEESVWREREREERDSVMPLVEKK